MRKMFLILLFVFLLAACGNSALSKDFKSDVEQVLPIIEESHKNQEDYLEQERDLLKSFSDKYEKGQYIPRDKDEYYEMNDIEKAILAKVISMRLFAIELEDEEETLSLASETKVNNDLDLYKIAEEELSELMKINNVEDLPEDLKGKYPTYEVYQGMYPEQFLKDAKELLDLYDPVVNGIQSDVTDKEWYPLVDFLAQYQGKDTTFPIDYEQEGKKYLIDSSMREIINMFSNLRNDIDEGGLKIITVDEFNSIVDLIDRTDI